MSNLTASRSSRGSLARRLGAPSAALLALVLAPARAHAGGFYVPEQGARSVAMGGAAVASSGEPSSIFHNPAGIAGSGTLRAEIDALVVFPKFTFFRRPAVDPYPADPANGVVNFAAAKNTNKLGVVPSLWVTSDLGVPDLGVGLGVYVPFGAELTMPDDGAQRNVITKVALKSIYVTPTIAYRFFHRLRVGLGLSYIHSSFSLRQKNASSFILGNPDDFPNPAPETEGDTQIDATDSAKFGATVGVQYTDPEERFAIGASLMTPAKLDFRGQVDVTNRPNSIVAMNDQAGNPLPAGRRTDDVAIPIPLPMIVRIGAEVRPSRHVKIALDANYQRWSTTQQLNIYFAHHYPLLPQPGAEMSDIVVPQSYRDTVSLRLGTEVTPWDLEKLPLALRAGALFDQSPIDDRHFDLLTPDSDKLGVTLGAGYVVPVGAKTKLGFDLAYMHLFYAERDVGPATVGTNDTFKKDIPGSDRTILNKPAPSFFYGITRASVDLLAVSVSLRI